MTDGGFMDCAEKLVRLDVLADDDLYDTRFDRIASLDLDKYF